MTHAIPVGRFEFSMIGCDERAPNGFGVCNTDSIGKGKRTVSSFQMSSFLPYLWIDIVEYIHSSKENVS